MKRDSKTMPGSRRWIITAAIALGMLLVAAALLRQDTFPIFDGVRTHLLHILDAPLFNLGKQPLTALSLIKIALFLALLGVVAHTSMSFLQKRLLTYTKLAAGQTYAIARVFSYLIFSVGMMIGLQSLGLDLSSLVVLGGALGLGVGLGLQTVVSNFVAGLILLLEQPVKIGDRVQVGDTYGDVVAMKGRSTWVRTNDNVVIIVPNSNFIEQNVINWTANDRKVRVSLPLGVSYDSNPTEVREALLRIAAANPDVLEDPVPDVIFEDFGDSSLDFQLRVWTESRVQVPAMLKSDLYFAVFEEFRKRNIEIPFPQRDLHLRSISPGAAVALREPERKERGAA